jgi:hypothetical protein
LHNCVSYKIGRGDDIERLQITMFAKKEEDITSDFWCKKRIRSMLFFKHDWTYISLKKRTNFT